MNNVQSTNFHYQIPMDDDDGDDNMKYEHDGQNRGSMPAGQVHHAADSEDNVAQPYMSSVHESHRH